MLVDKVWRKYLLGCLGTLVLMLPIGYLFFQVFDLLGYPEPRDAPAVLQYTVLILILVALRALLYFFTDDAYDELQKRRMEKKKRR